MQIQLKSLAEEMQAIIKGLEKVRQELAASKNDGSVSEVFHKVYGLLFLFLSIFWHTIWIDFRIYDILTILLILICK